MSWKILRKKKFDPSNLTQTEIITLEEWQEYVSSDEDLIWAEVSPIADAYRKAGEVWIATTRLRHVAYFELNKTGYGNLRFKYINRHYVSIECERQTLKRVEKMWEVAEALNGYLFKNGTRFTEKKLQKLREKYDKSGKKAPNDNHEA